MKSIPPIDVPHTIQLIENFIRTRVSESGRNGVVIGVSGGLDSTVIASIAVRSLGPEKVNAFFYPSLTTPSDDLGDVKELCSILGVKLTIIDIQNIIQSFSAAIEKPEDKMALEWMNLKPRIRQTIWYFYANKLNCLVCGSSNKSELMIGYYTKFGDGAADILPIGDVYKTHVYQIAEFLELPQKILVKSPSAGLFEGQTDESEIGMTYTKLDSILFGLELFRTDEEIADRLEIPISEIKKVRSMIYRSEHKRRGPIIFKLGVRTPNIDWRIPLVEPRDY